MKAIQLLNTAILKTCQIKLETEIEEKLTKIADSPAVAALNMAITELSNKNKISKDQAAVEIVSTIKELDQLWTNYLLLEGSDRLKKQLSTD